MAKTLLKTVGNERKAVAAVVVCYVMVMCLNRPVLISHAFLALSYRMQPPHNDLNWLAVALKPVAFQWCFIHATHMHQPHTVMCDFLLHSQSRVRPSGGLVVAMT